MKKKLLLGKVDVLTGKEKRGREAERARAKESEGEGECGA